MNQPDVVIVGAGHNGLVAAVLLAKAGLKVRVLEEKYMLGGAVRTERPFTKAPNLSASTGAYLLGVMPPEVMAATDIAVPMRRRDPHYFLPTRNDGYLLFGSDKGSMQQQFTSFFSEADWRASQAMESEIAQIRDDIAPSWLLEPLSIEDTAARWVRPTLRKAFIELCRGSVGAYLSRFEFRSDLVKAMYAVTDGFSGVYGTWDTPGTGHNFLCHNMCRLPNSDGTWMVVEGGMGTVSKLLAARARSLGVELQVNAKVDSVIVEGGVAKGVVVNGEEVRARAVVVNADPFRAVALAGKHNLPWSFLQRVDRYRRDGTTFKLNLALKGVPKFKCLAEDRGQYGATIHLLPDERDVMSSLRRSFADVQEGRLPEFPTIEWYIHSITDPTMRDDSAHHTSALFVQWVPYALADGRTWATEAAGYAKHLLSICDRFAPGTSELVVDMMALHPQAIEEHFGMTRGHIHHVDNCFAFDERMPYALPIAGLYSCSAGTHPAGAVIGCGGHNAANVVVRELGLPSSR